MSGAQHRMFRDALDQLIGLLADGAAVEAILNRSATHHGLAHPLTDLLES